MAYTTGIACSTGDPVNMLTTGGGYYTSTPFHYCSQYPCPICNPPVYYPVPYYVPVVQPYTIGTIVIGPEEGLKEEVKGLKEEIKKLRKELARK